MSTLNFFDILTLQPDFFDDAGLDERIDKKLLQAAILRRCGDLLPLYTDSRTFKFFSNTFFYERNATIKKLLDTLELEYNPIENYNRKDELSTETVFTGGLEITDTNRISDTLNLGNRTNTKVTPATATEDLVSAFDSDIYQPKTRTTQSGETNTTVENNGSDTRITDEVNTQKKGGEDRTKETQNNLVRGNIGTTTTQSMIKQEREIALFNVYTWIAIEFEQNFFICVS